MARKAASIEYLERLLSWTNSRQEFCQLTNITPGNLSAYLNGTKSISWKRLKRCNEQIFGQPPAFIPVIEGHDLYAAGKPTTAMVPNCVGLYALFDSAMRVVYYGKATNLYAEIRQTLDRKVAEVKPWTGARNLKFEDISAYVSAYRFERGDANFRHDVEVLCHKLFVNNTFNKNSGTFKRKS